MIVSVLMMSVIVFSRISVPEVFVFFMMKVKTIDKYDVFKIQEESFSYSTSETRTEEMVDMDIWKVSEE